MVQNIIVILIIAAAVIYTVRKTYLSIKGKGGCQCSGCSHCSLAGKTTKKMSENQQKDGKPSCCSKKD